MSLDEQNKLFYTKYIKPNETEFDAINRLANQANEVISNTNYILDSSEALTYCLTHEFPSNMNGRISLRQARNKYLFSYVKNSVSQIEDTDVRNSVIQTVNKSLIKNKLEFVYINLSKGQKSRVRIISRMLWYNLYPELGGLKMEELKDLAEDTIKSDDTEITEKPATKRRGRPKKSTAAEKPEVEIESTEKVENSSNSQDNDKIEVSETENEVAETEEVEDIQAAKKKKEVKNTEKTSKYADTINVSGGLYSNPQCSILGVQYSGPVVILKEFPNSLQVKAVVSGIGSVIGYVKKPIM